MEKYSGKFVLRVPLYLHCYLSQLADENNISLNTTCTYLIASGLLKLGEGNSPKPSAISCIEILSKIYFPKKHISTIKGGLMPDYFVYENWTAESKAVIHIGNCGHCKGGRGCHSNPLGPKNGRWHGPYKTYLDAKNKAISTGRPPRDHGCI